VLVRSGDVEAALGRLRVVETARATTVAFPEGHLRWGTVEHAFAALAGLGIHDELGIELEGVEVPLAGGSALMFAQAIRRLGVCSSAPTLRVVRDGTVDVGRSSYAFVCQPTVAVEVHVDFGDSRIASHARWDGTPEVFIKRIAPARTFGFAHEVESLLALGLASHVTAESVVVIGPTDILFAGLPFESDEPARHKLLDLIGDLYLYGGPPVGLTRAYRPGHAATHAAVATAFERGLLSRT
jgi:UDP-3-O-[3-hydroxymyristoyl] N-acetylglucosamine deacetylase